MSTLAAADKPDARKAKGYRDAAAALRALQEAPTTVQQACKPQLDKLNDARVRGSRVVLVEAVAGLATDQPNAEAAKTVVDDAVALDPSSGPAIAVQGALAKTPCAQAEALRKNSPDQAEALLADLVALGDADTVTCAKKQRAQLAAQRAGAEDPRGVVERLGAQSTESVVPVLLGAAIALLVAFLLWRLARIAFPPPPTTIRTHGQWAGAYGGAGWVAAAGAVGAVLGTYLRDSWPVTLTPNADWWLVGLLAVLAAAALTWARMSELKEPQAVAPRSAVALRWAAWIWVLVAGFAGFLAATAWGWARQWLWVSVAVAAAILLSMWAGSKLRLSFGKFEGGDDAPAGFAAAAAAELVALGKDAPRGVYMVAGTDETQLPTDKLSVLPGGNWAAALLAFWRAVTPSSDLLVTGGFLAKEGGERGVAVSLRRGRRVQSSTTIESRLFAAADGTAKAVQPPTGDTAKAAQPAAERAAVWRDLATATAAWLLFELGRLTGNDKTGMAGADHWRSVALNAVATQRQDEGQDSAALALLLDAIRSDPGNCAAQYGRLALEARQIDGRGSHAEQDYQRAYEALRALPVDKKTDRPLWWRREYVTNALLLNKAKVSRDPADAETAAKESAKKLGELIDDLKLVTEENNRSLAKGLLSLSQTACLGAATMVTTADPDVVKAVQKATARPSRGLPPLPDGADRDRICDHARAWLDPKEPDLLEPRVAYNAACTRTLLDNVHVGKGDSPSKRLETLLRRAFQDRRLAKWAERDPFIHGLQQEWWYKALRRDMGVDIEVKPTGPAAFWQRLRVLVKRP